jgi:hypothetical protein
MAGKGVTTHLPARHLHPDPAGNKSHSSTPNLYNRPLLAALRAFTGG